MRMTWLVASAIVSLALMSGLVPRANADLFPEPQIVVEPAYLTSGQVHPDVAFDDENAVHVVWSGDPTTGIDRIFHKKIDATGSIGTTEPVEIDGPCVASDCGLDYPSLAIAGTRCTVVYPGSASHPSVDSSELNTATGIWSFTGQADVGTYGPFAEVAVAAYGDYLILAHPYQGGFRFVQCDHGVWQPLTEYLLLPAPGVYFANIDIAVDDDGYFYAVFDIRDTNSLTSAVYVGRSTNPYNPIGAFLSFRAVEAFHSEVFQSFPSISVTGSAAALDLAVTIGWVHLNTGNPQVFAQTEFNGLWSTSMDFGGTGSRACSWTSGVVAKHLDVHRDTEGVVRMVWLDLRVENDEVYGAVSYNNASSFLPDECVSCISENLNPVTDPAIAVSNGPAKTTAIVFSRLHDGFNHAFISFQHSLLYDSCDGDFSNWDTGSGVEIDPSVSHDPGGASFKFLTTGKRGVLMQDFSPDQLTGSIDFWFYDSMSVSSDFRFRIDGDDGQRAGVYRMIGINNASSHTTYSVDDGSGVWLTTTASRSTGWHHVIASVRNGLIEIFMDPEINTEPVVSSIGFEYFYRIEFEGGTDADPYHLDDVHVIGEVLRATPSLSVSGIILLLVSIGVVLLRCRH